MMLLVSALQKNTLIHRIGPKERVPNGSFTDRTTQIISHYYSPLKREIQNINPREF